MKPETKQTITINNHQMTYYKLGHGKQLLFLHGGRIRALTFHKLITHLAKEYTVIAPDIPGYGDSETPKDVWSFTEYADFFDSFLQELKIDKVTVMGYSMGGGIAFNLAARSNRVDHLVLIDASGLPLTGAKQSHHDMRRLSFYLTHPQYFSSFWTLITGFSQFSWKHRRDWKHMRDIRRRCFATSYATALGRVKVPTIILWGQDDWIHPVVTAEKFRAGIPRAHIKIVHGNHDWLLYNSLQISSDVFESTS